MIFLSLYLQLKPVESASVQRPVDTEVECSVFQKNTITDRSTEVVFTQ